MVRDRERAIRLALSGGQVDKSRESNSLSSFKIDDLEI